MPPFRCGHKDDLAVMQPIVSGLWRLEPIEFVDSDKCRLDSHAGPRFGAVALAIRVDVRYALFVRASPVPNAGQLPRSAIDRPAISMLPSPLRKVIARGLFSPPC